MNACELIEDAELLIEKRPGVQLVFGTRFRGNS